MQFFLSVSAPFSVRLDQRTWIHDLVARVASGELHKQDLKAGYSCRGAAAELHMSSYDTTHVLDGVNGEEWQRLS